MPEVEYNHHTDGTQNGQEGPQFRIRKDRTQFPPGHGSPDEKKVATGQNHRYHGRYFQKQIVVTGKIEGRRTAARRSRGHSLIDSFEHI